jgi:hypothetical protein
MYGIDDPLAGTISRKNPKVVNKSPDERQLEERIAQKDYVYEANSVRARHGSPLLPANAAPSLGISETPASTTKGLIKSPNARENLEKANKEIDTKK